MLETQLAPRLRHVALVAVATGIGVAAIAVGQQAPEMAPTAPTESPRNANYTIEASLDAEGKTLDGRQTLRWRNIQETATDELWFHLYWNAWRNDHSTWMREDLLRGRSDLAEVRRGDWGWLEVETATLAGVDLMATHRFAAPDNGNVHDRTVMVFSLPEAVQPGDEVTVELTWRAKIPRTFARTGYRDDFFFIAHWFPKLGVYEPEGWNCHHFHAATEFFSDYGVYDVTLDLPSEFVVGATGRRVKRDESGPRTRHQFVQEDVHGFAWTASPDYLERTDRFAVPGLPPVDIRLLMQPEHLHQADRHLHATKATLEHYGRWYGPYPYAQITVIDPLYRSGAGGMEYPTLFTSGTQIINPKGGGSPEGVTVHEAGHQFWYGLVGNNEFEHAWLDEGLNTFSTARVMNVTYDDTALMGRYLNFPGGEVGGFLRVLSPEFVQTRAIHGNRFSRYIASEGPTMDAMSVPSFQAFPAGIRSLSYHKTATWLHTLERFLGWDVLQPAMASFFARWQFGHPRPEDFFAVIEEESGQDLDWFFDQVYYDSVQFDYALASIMSKPADVRGFVNGLDGLAYWDGGTTEDREGLIRTDVVVRRLGGGIFPVDVLMVFEDGVEVRRRWDGRARWHRFIEERPSELAYAMIDPDRTLLLDLNYTNNSRVQKNHGAFAARKWGAKWMIWLQDILTTMTFFL